MAITVNFATQQIDIPAADAIAGVDLQALNDAARAAEETEIGMTFPRIIENQGKVNLRSGVDTGIVLILADPWQLKFEDTGGDYIALVTGGTLVGGLGGAPIAHTARVLVRWETPVDSTRVATTGADENAIAAAVEGKVIEGSLSIGGALRLLLAEALAQMTGPAAGQAGDVTIKSPVTPSKTRAVVPIGADGYRGDPTTLDGSA